MPVINSIDTVLTVFKTTSPREIGSRSIYSETPHPATNKKIEGWKWDQRLWPTPQELEAISYAPSLWDPEVSGLDVESYQDGIGDNNDLLLSDVQEIVLSGIHHWAPKINHGYFYVGNEEWFFYSDDYITQYLEETSVSGTHQILQLSHEPKPTIPIQVRRYRFNKTESQYEIDLNVKKKVEFTVSGVDPEFILSTETDPPTVELNGTWTRQVAEPVVTFPGDILNLELLGFSTGNPNQEFQTEFYPIDRSQPVEVWVWSDPVSGVAQWDVISGLQTFTSGLYQVYVDYDTGSIKFGDYVPLTDTGNGRIPNVGRKIGIHYTAGLTVCYEPNHSSNYITALNARANINPVYSSISTGFVQLNTELIEPGSISLDANLPRINPYLIDLGNNVGELVATVLTKAGNPIEGQEVFFEILDPIIGTFGTSSTLISAITRSGGRAQTLYNSPRTALEAGQATTEVALSGPDTILYVDGITDPGDVNRLFIYKVHDNDPVLGIPVTGVDQYYADYLAEEDMVSGVQGTQAYEETFRSLHSLPTPTTYAINDIVIGKKTICLTQKPGGANVVDPNTGDIDSNNLPLNVWSPLRPDLIEDLTIGNSPRLKLTFNNVNLSLPGLDNVKSYFIIGDAQTRIRAYTVNPRTNEKLYSNVIQMQVSIPDSLSGSYFVDDLNTLPQNILDTLLKRPRNIYSIPDSGIQLTSGIEEFWDAYQEEREYVTISGMHETYVEWFRRTRKADSAGLALADALVATDLGPEDIALIDTNDFVEIPLGFRLRSTGITVASLLDQVTFITPNDILPSGYFNIE